MTEHDVVVTVVRVRRDQGLDHRAMSDDASLEPALPAQYDALDLASVRQRSKNVFCCFRASHV